MRRAEEQLGTVPGADRPPPALPRPPPRPVRPLPACPGTPQPARWRVAWRAGWRAGGRPGCYPAPDMARSTWEPLAPGLKEDEAGESAGHGGAIWAVPASPRGATRGLLRRR